MTELINLRPMPTPPRMSTPASPKGSDALLVVLTALPALLVIVARLWSGNDSQALAHSSTVISIVSCAHGMTLFVVLGRDRLTMSGCFMACSAAIVGLSGLLVIPDPAFLDVPLPDLYLNTALFVSTLTQIGIGALSLKFDARTAAQEQLQPVTLTDAVAGRAQAAGIITLIVTIALGDRLGEFLDGFGFSAVLLISIASLLSIRGLRSPLNVFLILGANAAFLALIISGTGRLRAIALLLAITYVFFLRYGRRWMKVLAVVLAPGALAVLGIWRREYEEALSGQHGNDTGLSSMFVAIGNFGTLIHASDEGLAPTLGASLLSPIRSALPEGLSPSWIPEATGYELSAITDPELYGTGFSTVVSVYGDLWWNFGALGLVAGVPVLAIVLDRIDSWAVRSYQQAAEGPRQLLLLIFFSSLLGGVGDVVWSGFHTWVVRMYGRIAALLVLALLTLYVPSRHGSRFVSFQGIRTGTVASMRPAAVAHAVEG